MALLETAGSKKFYTRKQDETIIAMRKQGKSIEEVATAIGHSPASVQYRIQRVLTKVNSFDEIDYKGESKPEAAPEAETKK